MFHQFGGCRVVLCVMEMGSILILTDGVLQGCNCVAGVMGTALVQLEKIRIFAV